MDYLQERSDIDREKVVIPREHGRLFSESDFWHWITASRWACSPSGGPPSFADRYASSISFITSPWRPVLMIK